MDLQIVPLSHSSLNKELCVIGDGYYIQVELISQTGDTVEMQKSPLYSSVVLANIVGDDIINEVVKKYYGKQKDNIPQLSKQNNCVTIPLLDNRLYKEVKITINKHSFRECSDVIMKHLKTNKKQTKTDE